MSVSIDQLRIALAYLTGRKSNPKPPSDLEALGMTPNQVTPNGMKERAEDILFAYIQQLEIQIAELDHRTLGLVRIGASAPAAANQLELDFGGSLPGKPGDDEVSGVVAQ